MKNAKEKYYNKEILNCLMGGEIVSTQYIADTVGLSEKSIRNKITNINDYLQENNLGVINKKPRVGIWLEMNDEQKQKLESFLMKNAPVSVNYDETERMVEILKLLFKLRPWETISTQKLSEELYLSSPTILKVIKECEKWLSKYKVNIINERNKGFRLGCRENEYRVALKNLIMFDGNIEQVKKNLEYFFYNLDTKMIQKSIIETENEWNYRFTDESFYEILIYCCIAYQRKDIQTPVLEGAAEFEILQKYNEYPFTVAIFKKLQDKFHILFSNEDVLFLSIQIMCSKFIGISAVDETLEQVKKYDNKLIEFVDLILQVVGNILDADFSDDQKLKESLIFHLRPTIFRIRYGTPQSNSLINFIKSEYKNVYRATWAISLMFEEYYGLQLTEDEVGYIVLYIQSALERKGHQYKMVLIADSSRGHAQLLSERIKKMIPEISDIDIMGAHDFKLYGNEEADIIVTSKDLDIKDKRIVTIVNLLSESGIVSLRNHLNNLNYRLEESANAFSPVCFPLLNPEIIFVDQKCQDKDTLLKFMATAMEMKGFVTSGFYDSVMEREKATTTSIGNGISLPHGAQSEVVESKVAIAILNEPIMWNDDQVDIVFLLAFKMETPDEINRIQMFYKQYISLIETEDKIKKLKNMNSNIDLYKYLIQ